MAKNLFPFLLLIFYLNNLNPILSLAEDVHIIALENSSERISSEILNIQSIDMSKIQSQSLRNTSLAISQQASKTPIIRSIQDSLTNISESDLAHPQDSRYVIGGGVSINISKSRILAYPGNEEYVFDEKCPPMVMPQCDGPNQKLKCDAETCKCQCVVDEGVWDLGPKCQPNDLPQCKFNEKLYCFSHNCSCKCMPKSSEPGPIEYLGINVYENQAEFSFRSAGLDSNDQLTVHGGLAGSNMETFSLNKSVKEINSLDNNSFLVTDLIPSTDYWFKISSPTVDYIKDGSFRTLCMLGEPCNPPPGGFCKKVDYSNARYFVGEDNVGWWLTQSEDRSCYSCGGLNEPCCEPCCDECPKSQACDNPYTCQYTGYGDKCKKQQSDDNLKFSLPESIYLIACEDPSLDMDLDGLKDYLENILAEVWRPYFIYDEGENNQGGWDINDNSLQPWEPVVLFQVRPTGYHKIVIKWAFLYRLDGGYRGSNTCLDWHYGDTQGGSSQLFTLDGITWELSSLSLWSNDPLPSTFANNGLIEWSSPRSTYWGEMDSRPSPIVHASAGKHHQYMTAANCEGEHDCDDDCDGGAHRIADLVSGGSFHNVGEPDNHPSPPFVTNLEPLGYPGEHVWYSSFNCKCSSMGAGDVAQPCFTGGLGENWDASGGTFTSCTIPDPVYTLFSHEELPPNPG